MRILLLGATGFLGRHICAHLLSRGHEVIAGGRDLARARRRFPGIETRFIDMNLMVTEAAWAPALSGVEAVVNGAGILQSGRGQHASAIHEASPIALFKACVAAGISRVVQISAVSADVAAGTEYARTKSAADAFLKTLDLDWVILRPSLVYAQGSFGGTSALRGLAGLPFFTPIVGQGTQEFQPIHAEYLARTVAWALETGAAARRALDPVGPETLTLREILSKLRAWLDFPARPFLRVPVWLAFAAARVGDFAGRGALRSTAITQLLHGNVSDPEAFARMVGFKPRRFEQALLDSPSHVQDRWQARLYWLAPALTAALAAMWLGSGIASLMDFPASLGLAVSLGVPRMGAGAVTVAFALADVAIGLGVLCNRPRALGWLQFCLVSGYTLYFTLKLPGLWLNPLGPLLKNLPALAAIGIWSALREDT